MLVLAGACLLVISAAAEVLAGGPPAVVSVRAVLATNAVHPGQAAKIAVLAEIKSGYHINDHKPSLDYLIPTKVTFEDSPSLKVQDIVYPHGTAKKFAFLDTPISVYEGGLHLKGVLKVGHSARPGTYSLRGKLNYQACNDHACLPPASAPIEISVRVVPSTVPLQPANPGVFRKASRQ